MPLATRCLKLVVVSARRIKLQLEVNLDEMARDQVLDPDYQRISQEARTGLHFKKVNLGQTNIIVDNEKERKKTTTNSNSGLINNSTDLDKKQSYISLEDQDRRASDKTRVTQTSMINQ